MNTNPAAGVSSLVVAVVRGPAPSSLPARIPLLIVDPAHLTSPP
jgi:hypothetical protein